MKNKLILKNGENSFLEKYKFLNQLSYYSSWGANITDIILMFFFVYPILIEMSSIESKFGKFLAFIFSIGFLFIFEYVKRFLIYESFTEFLINKLTIKFKFLLVSFLSLLLCTGYMAISGTQEITFKKYEVVENISNDTNKEIKELELKKESEIENTRNDYKKTLESANAWGVTKGQEVLNERDSKIDNIKNEYAIKISNLEKNSKLIKNNKIESGEELLIKAIVLTILIELIIILGVMFIGKYHYEEMLFEHKKDEKERNEKEKRIMEIKSSPEYQRYKEDMALLTSLYKSKQTSNSLYIGKYLELKPLLELNMKNFETPKKKRFDTFLLFLKQNSIITGEINKYKFVKSFEQAKNILTSVYEFDKLENIEIDN